MRAHLAAAFTLALAALALWMARKLHREHLQTLAWPTTTGRILERSLGSMSASARAVEARVKYAYTVDGRQFEGDRVYVTGHIGGGRAQAQALLDSLPDAVPVHYDPQDPAQAFLLQNPRSTFWLVLVVGILGALAGLAQVLVIATQGMPDPPK